MANDEFVDYVELYQDKKGEWRWAAKAGNHKTVADSGEGYEDRLAAEHAAAELYPGKEIVFNVDRTEAK